jgi:hypothetical protein
LLFLKVTGVLWPTFQLLLLNIMEINYLCFDLD